MKRHKSLSSLSSDHHHGLRIAKMLKSAGNISDSDLENNFKEFTDFYNSQLLNHFEAEERFLTPALKDNPLILKMLEEHRVMREKVAELNLMMNVRTEFIWLGSYLESHIRFEEKELFPFIENTLPEEKLEEIGRSIEKQKGIG